MRVGGCLVLPEMRSAKLLYGKKSLKEERGAQGANTTGPPA